MRKKRKARRQRKRKRSRCLQPPRILASQIWLCVCLIHKLVCSMRSTKIWHHCFTLQLIAGNIVLARLYFSPDLTTSVVILVAHVTTTVLVPSFSAQARKTSLNNKNAIPPPVYNCLECSWPDIELPNQCSRYTKAMKYVQILAVIHPAVYWGCFNSSA